MGTLQHRKEEGEERKTREGEQERPQLECVLAGTGEGRMTSGLAQL